jgi:hypothetical protein
MLTELPPSDGTRRPRGDGASFVFASEMVFIAADAVHEMARA